MRRHPIYSSSGSSPDFIICPFCEGGELAGDRPTISARCTGCGRTADGSLLETLRQIIALPDAPRGAYACDRCGHPQMRRPPDEEGLRCPACGPEASAAPLTRREEEVALLIARGLTNRQISAELAISELTVASHVRGILKKQGLRWRAQIAERQPRRKDRP